MFQAITTKFLGPTSHRPARIVARASAGSVVVSWDYGLNSEANHAAAAKALASKFGWRGNWVAGGLPDNTGDVFVCIHDGTPTPAFTISAEA
ncbi:hypothetical protein [Labrys neptuniae]